MALKMPPRYQVDLSAASAQGFLYSFLLFLNHRRQNGLHPKKFNFTFSRKKMLIARVELEPDDSEREKKLEVVIKDDGC